MAFLAGLGDDGQTGAPMDFQISSSSSSSEGGPDDIRSLYARECPVCSKWKKHFVCKDCISKGEFWMSGNSNLEGLRFQELHVQLLSKLQHRAEIVEKCEKLTESKQRVLQLIEEMEVYERTVAFQKQLKCDIEKKLAANKQESSHIKKQNDEKDRIWPMYRSRLYNMEQQREKRVVELKKKAAFVSERRRRLQELSKSRILQLKQYIFPVHEVYADSAEGRILNDKFQASNVTLMSSNDSWSDEDDDTVRSLIAATSHRGRIGAGISGGCSSPTDLTVKNCLFHSITGVLGPSLPVSGDYSAFNTETETAAQARGAVGRNPAHVITAGLTFLTQLVNMISYYLDLRLPHRLSYSEFSIGCHANRKFNRKVAKLNANVIHLCTSQGIPASYLQPRKTVANLMLLFDPSLTGVCYLGRRGPFEVAIQLAKSMEESIEKDLVIYEEDSSDSDEGGDYFPSDWETVHRGAITEEMSQLQCMTRQMSYVQQSTMDSESFMRSRSQSGMASNLVSSVTSFFRGWNS